MRPVRRGDSPRSEEFDPYTDAFVDLVSRLGPYCSYCERRIATNLSVEHIRPKKHHPALRGTWHNFLLGCVNCNSTKGDKDIKLNAVLLPDRDNTARAFRYPEDGTVEVAPDIGDAARKKAEATLTLVGLDKVPPAALDANGHAVAIERVSQRMQTWIMAKRALGHFVADRASEALQSVIVDLARAQGFFGVWMAAFDAEPTMKQRFVGAFEGTQASGCYGAVGQILPTPAPNPDGLASGGKL